MVILEYGRQANGRQSSISAVIPPTGVRRALASGGVGEMREIVGWSLRFRSLVMGMAAAALVAGVIQASRVPVDTLPEFSPPYVEIQTEALGLSAHEVEQLITVPLEADLLHGVPFLHRITSQSVAGMSSIVLTFVPGTDIYRARQVVGERLTQAHALPQVSRPPAMLQPLSSTNRVLMVGLASDQKSLIEMSVLARWTIRPRLLSVPGVANVAIWGQREQQLQVLVDPARLRAKGVTLQQVIATTGNALWVSPLTFLDASTPGTGGFIDTPNQRFGIQHVLPILSPDDLARVVIEGGQQAGGADSLRLADVATVVQDHQPLIGDAVVNGGPGLMLVVEKFPGADTLAVTRGVEEALAALQPGLPNISVDTTVFRPASYLDTAIANLAITLPIALVLMLLIVGVMLNDWRATVVAAMGIALAVLVAVGVLTLLGSSLDALIVAGLVLAAYVAVDDAVAGFAAVSARLRDPASGTAAPPLATTVMEATLATRGPLAYAVLILVAAVIPLLLAGGVAGVFMPSLLVPYLLALVASTVVALTVTPALCVLLAGLGRPPGREASAVSWLRRTHGALLSRLLSRARAMFLIATVATLASAGLVVGVLAPRVGAAPLPAFRQPNVVVQWDGPPGTSRAEMNRIVSQAGRELRAIDGVVSVGGHVGRAIAADQVVGIESAELWLALDPAADHARALAAVGDVVGGFPGVHSSIQTYAAQRVNQVLPDAQGDITVRVYGQELDVLRAKAAALRMQLASLGGVARATVAQQVDEPTVQIRVDLAAAARSRLTPGEVRRVATTLLSGLQVGSLFEDQKVFEVVVWGTPELRQSLDAVRDLPIETQAGGQVRLGDVATVAIEPDPTVIRREGVFRYVDVAVVVAGRAVDEVARDIQGIVRGTAFPLEYRAEVLGDYAERQAEQVRRIGGLVAVGIVVFLLLQAAFLSWRLAAVLLVSMPGGLLGGVLAGLAMGEGASLGALAGLLVVMALAIRHALALIGGWRDLARRAEPMDRATLLRGAGERVGPIVTTTLAVGAASVSILLLGDRPGLEVLRPMAIVIPGGLITAGLVNLLVVPVLSLRLISSRMPSATAASVDGQQGLAPVTG